MLSAWTSNSSPYSSDKNMNTDDKKKNISKMHLGSSEVPKSLKKAESPTYKVGSQVIVKADHMKGMYGTKANIVGAYDTTAYAVTYTPTTGGPMVKNHKWVIQEEIKKAGHKTLKPGTEVTLEANHMKGMMGAKGTINSAVHTTVYMIDYIPTTGGPIVKNHKWVIESELSTK
ncbi:YdhK family protein [Neobacillus drentensis]|nr:YdhK family protein [Neobacillus drentensis]ULT59769.1 YdhK family protein [Neobacillus drentensis]